MLDVDVNISICRRHYQDNESNTPEGLASEETVQDTAIISVDFAGHEHPVIILENSLGRVNETRLGIRRTMQDLPRILVRRRHNNKA